MNLAVSIYIYWFSAFIAFSLMAKIVLKLLNKYDETPKAVQVEELISLLLFALGCAGMIAAANN